MAHIEPPPFPVEEFGRTWKNWFNNLWKEVVELGHEAPSATQTNLTDISADVNTTDKYTGRYVWDETNTKPVFAGGNTAAALWHNADGTTAHTPV